MATFSSSPLLFANPDSGFSLLERTCKIKMLRRTTATPPSITAASLNDNDDQNSSSKLVTFIGKGGSGKTTSAIFAAQHYAMSGLRTCLVIQTQDPSAEYLLNYKIGTSPTECSDNLWAVRLETSKMLLEPLDRLKQANSRLKMTQGVLEGVVGEELGVLPAMDSIFAVYALAGLVGSLNVNQTNRDKFDIIVYDGVSTDETLRVIGAASKARLVEFLTSPTQLSLIFLSVLNNITVLRLYLKYLRNLAEKTDLGRLAGPSLVSLVDEALSLSGSKYNLNRKTSAEIWDSLEKTLMQGSSAFYEPSRFGCYLVMDPNIPTSVNAALRYWGCTLQAGAQVSGAIGISSPRFNEESLEGVKKNFLPLPFAFIPHLSIGYPPEWNSVMLNTVGHDARTLFSLPASHSNSMAPPVKFDAAEKSVTLFMPGFDKSEIKLYQYRGGSELLVEAGDQRRVICLPTKIQGKVGGAKFFDRSLVIKMR